MNSTLPPPERKREFVREMFDRIAPRYDRLNRVISLGLDQRWRRELIRAARIGPGDRVADLATGTGDLAELAEAAGARVFGFDLAHGMLRAGRVRRPGTRSAQADGAALPLADASLDALLCGFALRNFADLEAVLCECARVLVPGGRIALLDVDTPRRAVLRWGFDLHFRRVVPALGAWLSDAAAYRYLPDSTTYLPPEAELRAMLERAGFEGVHKQSRMAGGVQLLSGERGA